MSEYEVKTMDVLKKENETLRTENEAMHKKIKQLECQHSWDVDGCCELCGAGSEKYNDSPSG